MGKKKVGKDKAPHFKFVLFLVLVFLSGILSLKAMKSFNDFQKGMKIFQEKAREKKELEEKVASLQKTLSQINSPGGLALFLKQKFGLVEEGEKLVYVVWPKEEENQSKNSKNFLEQVLNFLHKGFNKIFNKNDNFKR